MSKALTTLKREAKRAIAAEKRRHDRWLKKREALQAKGERLQEKWEAEAQAFHDEYEAAEADYKREMEPLQKRAAVFDMALQLAQQGMDPVIAKLTAPHELEEYRKRVLEAATAQAAADAAQAAADAAQADAGRARLQRYF